MLSRALDVAVNFDGLNIANLASFEQLIRQKQLLAEAYVANPSTPSYEGSDHFFGTGFRPGFDHVLSNCLGLAELHEKKLRNNISTLIYFCTTLLFERIMI